MRKLKFRAWDSANNEMYIVKPLQWWQLGDEIASHENEPIMQFSGLKDSKGVEIYDGDIVADEDGNTAEIRWSRRQAQFYADYEDYQDLDGINQWATVIGNIYKNKDLLK